MPLNQGTTGASTTTPPDLKKALKKVSKKASKKAIEEPLGVHTVSATSPAKASIDDTVEQPPKDPWARPNFVKGQLNQFFTQPRSLRNFFGVGTVISAIPNDADSLLNAFHIRIEPQIDIINDKYNWRLGLGAPLQFQLVDTQGTFELCVQEGRRAFNAGGDEGTVAAETGKCLGNNTDRITEGFGQLRKADWDEPSDFAKLLRYFTIGGQEQPFYLSVGRLFDQTLGHGTVVRNYNPNIDYNTTRVGATLDFSRSFLGLQAMANDLINPDVVGILGFVRPFRETSKRPASQPLPWAFLLCTGPAPPLNCSTSPGFSPRPLASTFPKLTNKSTWSAAASGVSFLGVDIEGKVLRTERADIKLYADYQKMSGFGSGVTLGSLWRYSTGTAQKPQPMPSAPGPKFNTSTRTTCPTTSIRSTTSSSTNICPGRIGVRETTSYYPTKLGYLDANRGGLNVWGYLSVTHSIRDVLTYGLAFRGFEPTSRRTPNGSNTDGFSGPMFPDYGANCLDPARTGLLDCQGASVQIEDTGFLSMRLQAEMPFRKVFQAYAAYEVFSTNTEKGLGAFSFDGDNEVFISGARLMVLPILFIQAQARRYFFLQRLSDIDLAFLEVNQDQNYHAEWTFSLTAFMVTNSTRVSPRPSTGSHGRRILRELWRTLVNRSDDHRGLGHTPRQTYSSTPLRRHEQPGRRRP